MKEGSLLTFNSFASLVLQCHRGPYCAFAHTRKEIRCKLFSKEDEDNPNVRFAKAVVFVTDSIFLFC